MRKWMRDKLKRRKKSQEAPATGPAPLQPAYFEAEPSSSGRAPEGDKEDALEAGIPANESVSQDDAAAEDATAVGSKSSASSASSASDNMRRPRRRRRGGRGRRRAGPQSAAPAQPVPATASPDAAPTSVSGTGRPASAVTGVPATSAPHTAKGTVVLAVGLPGSGKSSWFKRHNIAPLSSDVLRTMLFDDPGEQRFQELVFSNLRSMLRARLIARRPMNYVDATNLTPHERHNWIKLAKDYGYEVHAVFFDVPLETCIERHHRRDRTVPEDVMRKMAAKLKVPSFDEGFSKITVVRVKQKEA